LYEQNRKNKKTFAVHKKSLERHEGELSF